RIGFVFQSYNLIPHQSVLANVELALTLSGVSRRERHARAKEALTTVGLADHINKKPNQLSGGQMQRVAVARALINNPEILLADEPTGALDSTTSTQIMELLTNIAKDRLVIMVTHNPELADAYANRIVNLLDGKVVKDSNPFKPVIEKAKTRKKSVHRTRMSFFTAIMLSFNNLLTKKGRTIMTAFAGSIGIIGIAAILALANGVNNYIKSVEEDTLTVYPLSIESTGFDMTTMMASMMSVAQGSDSKKDGEPSNTVSETKILSEMFSRIGANDLASLKVFLDSGQSGIDPYVNLITYNYGIGPLIFAPDTKDGIRQVNPNTAFSGLNSGSLSGSARSYASMMTSGGNTNVFSRMLNNPTLLEAQYEVVAGYWPQKYNECILVLNYEGGVSDYVLYAMGLRDPKELERMIEDIANNRDVSAPSDILELSYEEIMAVTFKLVHRSATYSKDVEHNIWVSKTDDAAFMKNLIEKGEDLYIVGIVKPNPDAAATSLSPGICYRSDLQLHLIEMAGKSPIAMEQLQNPKINVISGRSFEDEKENPDRETLDFSSMINVDGEKISAAFSFDDSMLTIDFSALSNIGIDGSTVPAMPPFDLMSFLEDLLDTIEIEVTDEELEELFALIEEILTDFAGSITLPTDPTDPAFSLNDLYEAFLDYLEDNDVQDKLLDMLGRIIGVDAIIQQAQLSIQYYMASIMSLYMNVFMNSISQQMTVALTSAMSQLAENIAGAMRIDESMFANAFQFNLTEKDVQELMMSLMTAEESTYESNLRSFGYADLNVPTSISIYPKDFAGKEKIIQVLDDYNDRMSKSGQEDRVITYTDIVGTLMSSVTNIVNTVSYVLVAFVAISLVVSSIMIGIITYISVLERKKEIGILRSIGASKGDIGRVFNAETLIVGFVAGIIGITATSFACIPANIIVYERFAVANVASLPWEAAVVLVGISMLLSFVAGIIPSSAASRRDPVEALRSE
ncbi:MAG: ATP-binding cassette domain-containing protein, partial [Eggerthellaceae bacterium]|nr:ATP-binding cassette domain-containing protein [Eggerthellaceae bacterium]